MGREIRYDYTVLKEEFSFQELVIISCLLPFDVIITNLSPNTQF
jgi:hypothetical protein